MCPKLMTFKYIIATCSVHVFTLKDCISISYTQSPYHPCTPEGGIAGINFVHPTWWPYIILLLVSMNSL